ncbi:hypothetical protein SELMODRAFT_228892 [Selaginella moellendorffii]|uniref:Hydroxymethylglutaryl-CoA synthase n=1 Tax=Selaginella moellendorffii TaxID=88036 RepID=D8SHR5_SELML|nr:hydroxymethylglutaryl-CoA synthase [Selaginella moellendorffii]EFJ16163.1 hypothetical protein SELMODRAFT_228892 [Selaginella moellendorffii]|eukprot:XP_024543571.1 hydroxymethylglutaryl-CoA synthase [Selaginella moellendorffii]
MAGCPGDVGILALEVYFPPSCVRQDELEKHDGVSAGKYTAGLGQERLAFCTDVEDVISMSLTVVKNLLEKYSIAPEKVGRLEVGSETVIDKSKSIKTWLMRLFEESGNSDIQGVDSSNACYGGTAALINCLNWVESSGWDGRYGLVVAADSAVYAEGPARPSGGAGAVAMLIGPNAPFVIDRKYMGTHMSHTYDFYKPNLSSEYPVLDGRLSQKCYLMALDLCYNRYCQKYEKADGKPFSLQDVNYAVFHSPYNKLVQKSFARLVYNDIQRKTRPEDEKLKPFANISEDESYTNKDLEKATQDIAKPDYNLKVVPSTLIPKQVGNMYCAALYAALASLIHNKAEELLGNTILMFSYGSGLASSLFTIHVRQGDGLFRVANIAKRMEVSSSLESRVQVSPEDFVHTMELMETRYGAKGFTPVSDLARLRPGTFYLTQVDDLYRRFYDRLPQATSNGAC